jgi:hypothetical protein
MQAGLGPKRLARRKTKHLVLPGPLRWQVGEASNPHAVGQPSTDERRDTGEPFAGVEAMSGVRRFQTLIAAEDHLYVAADGRIYAFSF